jgi:hypothetical protein
MRVHHEHRTGCQVFQFAAYRWCIDHTEELIKADPDAARLVDDIPVEPFRQFLSLQPPKPGHLKLIEVDVDPKHAATTDLSQPIMIAPIITHSGERAGGVAIDGWHRIYRALSEGVRELPGYILTEETSIAAQYPWR